jgi:hypothetical protein
VTYKNINKKWVKYIIEKSAGDSVSRAMKFIKDIDELKQENMFFWKNQWPTVLKSAIKYLKL